MGKFFIFNGNTLPDGYPVQEMAKSKCRSGDGLFETMRMHKNDVLFFDYHFERLAGGMEALQLKMPQGFSSNSIKSLIQEVCGKNDQSPSARVRLTVFKAGSNDGSHREPDFIIESWGLEPAYTFAEPGLSIGIYPGAYKTANAASAYKTNYELYARAAEYAHDHQLDDCLIWNNSGNICDASIANVFWVKDGAIATPPLSEGCIAGVMRRHIVTVMRKKGFPVRERPLTIEMLLDADEAFLTNVIRGMRPVGKFQHVSYDNVLSKKLFTELIEPLVNP